MTRLRVLVDALSPRVGGGLTYATEQLSALERCCPEVELLVLAAPHNARHLRVTLRSEVRLVNVGGLLPRLLFEQLVMPLRDWSARVLYCPGNLGPVLVRRMPLVLTIQSAHYFGRGRIRPENRTLRRRIEGSIVRRSIELADRVVLVSQSLLEELRADRLPTGKCRVIRSAAPRVPERSVRPKSVSPAEPFLLWTGDGLPHKRLGDLLAAWSCLSGPSGRAPSLVVVGPIAARTRARHLRRLPPMLHGRIRFLGSVEERSTMRWLYEHALALVATSEVESFGLSLVEAASVGCSVIASDIPAHREAAGEYPGFFPPRNVTALRRLLESAAGGALPPGGALPKSSWEENARRLADVFRDVAGAAAVPGQKGTGRWGLTEQK